VLSSEEASAILKVLQVSPAKLPKIYEESPEIKYRGIRAGSIVRIWNYNASDFSATPRTLDYRLVKKGNFEMN
jgi:DNA-directed RNA polymerase subunit H (RpoH/RPB5)